MPNKIKFEMTLKELNFKFEGDYEQGQRLQTGISRTLGDLAKLQNNAIGAEEPRLIEAQVTNSPRSTRRKARATRAGGEAANGQQPAAEAAPTGGGSPSRRGSPDAPMALVRGLRTANFFDQPKTGSSGKFVFGRALRARRVVSGGLNNREAVVHKCLG